MAACTTTYFEAGRSWSARVAERNAAAAGAAAHAPPPRAHARVHLSPATLTTPAWSRRPTRCACARCASSPPPSPCSSRWSWFTACSTSSAIEGSYRVEQEKQTLDQLREENRQLRLSEAAADAARPHRQHGPPAWLSPQPQPGQVVHGAARTRFRRSCSWRKSILRLRPRNRSA